MSLDDTFEQTQIAFENPLTIKDVRLLLESIASHFKCVVNYNLESLGRIDCSSEKFKSDEYPSKIGGGITRTNTESKETAIAVFELEREYIRDEPEPYFTKFKFNLPPGYTLDEMSPGDSKLIREVIGYISK